MAEDGNEATSAGKDSCAPLPFLILARSLWKAFSFLITTSIWFFALVKFDGVLPVVIVMTPGWTDSRKLNFELRGLDGFDIWDGEAGAILAFDDADKHLSKRFVISVVALQKILLESFIINLQSSPPLHGVRLKRQTRVCFNLWPLE